MGQRLLNCWKTDSLDTHSPTGTPPTTISPCSPTTLLVPPSTPVSPPMYNGGAYYLGMPGTPIKVCSFVCFYLLIWLFGFLQIKLVMETSIYRLHYIPHYIRRQLVWMGLNKHEDIMRPIITSLMVVVPITPTRTTTTLRSQFKVFSSQMFISLIQIRRYIMFLIKTPIR